MVSRKPRGLVSDFESGVAQRREHSSRLILILRNVYILWIVIDFPAIIDLLIPAIPCVAV